MTTYKVGDVVHLRSGSPDLTVIDLKEGDATVEWVDDDGALNKWTLPAGGFEKAETTSKQRR